MKTDMGEYAVGAYLKLIAKCDVIEYNVIPPGGGNEGQGELDVIGYRFKDSSVFICEVATHLDGLHIGNNSETTVNKVREKHERQKQYVSKYLYMFEHPHFMFWSPVVPEGKKTTGLSEISGLELIINDGYTKKLDMLMELAKKESDTGTSDIGNPFFRTLQLLQNLRRTVKKSKREKAKSPDISDRL